MMRLIRAELKRAPVNRPIILTNKACAYCGATLTAATRSKDHVVGRRFVPKGLFNGTWNLILNACRDCNGLKSDLEDDISAITLQPDNSGGWAADGPDVRDEALRKAERSISRRTGKPVKISQESIQITGLLMGAMQIKFNMVSPPQIAEERVCELARYHLAGFFYLVTYSPEAKTGYRWPGSFMPELVMPRSDWGNPVAIAFAKGVFDWDPRVMATTSKGFFKIALRKHPSAAVWSFALEWNHSYRIIGFLGDEEAAHEIKAGFPVLESKEFPTGSGRRYRYRLETPLESDDILFGYEDGEPG